MINNGHREHCQIVDVIQGEGIDLRRRGREMVGLCPFHADTHPSFTVNPEKNVWFCFPCHEGGDVIRFIERLHGVGFKDALKLLGMDGNGTPPPRRRDPKRDEAKRIADWAAETSRRVCEALREINNELYTCSLALELPDVDVQLIAGHRNSLSRQWAILVDLDNDLNEAEAAIELWNQREDVDAFVDAL